MSYQVGVDLGSTFSAVAVCRAGGNPAPEIVQLAPRSAFLPTVVYANPDGSVLVGDDADRRALAEPERVARQFTRRIGDGVPLLVGGSAVPAEALGARFVSRMLDATAARLGGPATRAAVTHPAGWGAHRVAALRDALGGQGLFLPAPQAAVLAQAGREVLEPGATVAVYDLGGATFTAAVIRRVTADQFTMVGRAEELELGGVDFDEVVFSHVTAELGVAWESLDPTDPAVRAAVAALRRDCTAAKEALSANTDVLIPVSLPGITTQVRLGRVEFEEAISPGLDETVVALHRALDSAGVGSGELASVLLMGGSARIPLVTQAVSALLDRPVTLAADPKGIVAIGAALAARGLPDSPPTRVFPVRVPEPAVVAGEPFPVPGGRPPVPIGPPRPRDADRRWLGVPRTIATTIAATVLVVALTGGIAYIANRTKPAGSGADPVTSRDAGTGPVVETPETTEDTPTKTREKPPVTTSASPPRTRKSDPPRMSTTTTTTRPSTSSTAPTTTSPTSSTTSPRPSSAGVPSQGGAG